MSNVVITPTTDESGFYEKGKPHTQGGIEVVVDDSVKIEVEKHEYKMCNSAYNSAKTYSFVGKTNKEVLDEIFRNEGCTFNHQEADSGDFIICKSAVLDSKPYDRSGTPKDIINQMQGEHGCRVETGGSEYDLGGLLFTYEDMGGWGLYLSWWL
jgi:hypothetical protein